MRKVQAGRCGRCGRAVVQPEVVEPLPNRNHCFLFWRAGHMFERTDMGEWELQRVRCDSCADDVTDPRRQWRAPSCG